MEELELKRAVRVAVLVTSNIAAADDVKASSVVDL